MSSQTLRLKVLDVVHETGDAHSIVFEKPAGVSYKPGQFLTLRLPWEDSYVARCYSLSSAPDVDDYLKVTVKRVADGRGSNWVCDNVFAGHELDVLAPSGTFTSKSLETDYLLLACGSGIAGSCSWPRAVSRATARVQIWVHRRTSHTNRLTCN